MERSYRSEVGLVRSHNEDSIAVHTLNERMSAVIVADGMGGHRAGDVASQMAVDITGQRLRSLSADQTMDQLQRQLVKSVEDANQAIYEKARENEEMAGMGTTLIVAVILNNEVLIGHIGDSRAYVVNQRVCKQLTSDHSLVNELITLGEITDTEAKNHPRQHVLMKAVGTEPNIEPDIVTFTWAEGDTLLFCTDGLTNMVSEQMIHDVIREDSHLDEKVDKLVQHALEAGGADNISLALVKRPAESRITMGSD